MYEIKDSSTISGYDWKGKGTEWHTAVGDLTIQFKNGGLYKYESVDGQTVKDFTDAPSKGNFLNEVIKPKFPALKINSSTTKTVLNPQAGWPFPT